MNNPSLSTTSKTLHRPRHNSSNSNSSSRPSRTLKSKKEAIGTTERKLLLVSTKPSKKRISKNQPSKRNTHVKATLRSCIHRQCQFSILTWKFLTVIQARCHTILAIQWKCQSIPISHITRPLQDMAHQDIHSTGCIHTTLQPILPCKDILLSWDSPEHQILTSSIWCKCQCIHIIKVCHLIQCVLISQWSIQLQPWLSLQVKNLISREKICMGNVSMVLVTPMLLVMKVSTQSKDPHISVSTLKLWRVATTLSNRLGPMDQENPMKEVIREINLLSKNSRRNLHFIRIRKETNRSTVDLNVIAMLMETPATTLFKLLSQTRTQRAKAVANKWLDPIIWAPALTNHSMTWRCLGKSLTSTASTQAHHQPGQTSQSSTKKKPVLAPILSAQLLIAIVRSRVKSALWCQQCMISKSQAQP